MADGTDDRRAGDVEATQERPSRSNDAATAAVSEEPTGRTLAVSDTTESPGTEGERGNGEPTAGGPDDDREQGRRRGLGHRLRSIEPFYLGLLGLLSFFDDLDPALAFTQLFALCFLFFLWPLVAPLIGMVRSTDGDDEEGHPRDWLRNDDETREHLTFLAMLPVTVANPPLMVQDLWQALGGVVAWIRHRGSLPTAETYEQAVSYRVPFEGTWTVVNGSPVREHSHSWFYVNQRFAYDVVQTDESGRSRPERSPARVGQYYCYGEPILAPADGTVVDAYGASPESDRAGGFSHPLKGDIRGNYVVIQHAPGEYSSLVHLQPGSVTVEPGDRVDQGQQVGRCGHSGNSSEPHLHFQVQDHPDWALAASLPVRFEDVEVEWPGDPETAPALPAGNGDLPDFTEGGAHDRAFLTVGQRVSPRTPPAEEPPEVEGAESDASDTVSPEGGASRGGHSRSPANASDRRGVRDVRETLASVGVGLGLSGAVAFFGALLLATSTVAAVLLGGTVLAVAYALRALVAPNAPRLAVLRYLGRSAGLAIATVLLAPPAGLASPIDVGARTLGPALFVAGFAIYVALGEYDRWRLAASPSGAA